MKENVGCVMFVVYASIVIGFWGILGYVGYHFISKFW